MPLNVLYMQPAPRPTLPSTPRVVIVDADRRVLQSLSDLLGVSGEVDVVGRATDVRADVNEVWFSLAKDDAADESATVDLHVAPGVLRRLREAL